MDAILPYLYDQRRYTYCQTAALTWVAYDIALTLGDEVSFVWRRKWAMPKILYLIGRYVGLAILISHVAVSTYAGPLSDLFCKRWLRFYLGGPSLIAFVVDALLVIRIYALYGRNKWLLCFLIFLLVSQPILVIATMVDALNSVHVFDKPYFLPFPGCLGSESANLKLTLAAWIFTLICPAIFFALTLFKYIQSVRVSPRHDGTRLSLFAIAKESRDVSPLIALFLRDGTANFFVIFASMVVNMVFTLFTPGPDKQIGIPWIIATNAVMGSRLYLNLRGFIAGPTVPSFSPMELERHVDLPSSGTSEEKTSRVQLHWQKRWSLFASRDPGVSALKKSLSCRSVLECNKFDNADKLAYHSTARARIPSLSFEPGEFDGFAPEVISTSELELASSATPEEHVLDDSYSSENQTASDLSRSTLCTHVRIRSLIAPPTSPNYIERSSFDSIGTQRPRFSSASSDVVINSSGSLT